MAHLDPAWLDSMYNNRALVPGFATHVAGFAERSVQARRDLTCELDLAYGEGAGETLDVFPAAQPNAPVAVFIHGGYWRALDKADHSFVAAALHDMGACAVVPNYALCPAVSVAHICLQQMRALAWVWRHIDQFGGDPKRITVLGHSAGGHLAAMALSCLWPQLASDLPAGLVKSALSISGLFDMPPVAQAPFLRQDLQLSEADAVRVSPAFMPAPRLGRLYAVVGADESAEFLRQNRLIQQAWGRRRVPVCEALPGRQHFSVLEALCEPGHRLNQLARELLQ